jgi:hypothetical protein
MNEDWHRIEGTVVRGHQVASRASEHYPRGTIALQRPHFEALGLDLSEFFEGTLNVSIAPLKLQLLRPTHTFRHVNWTPAHPPEDFSFVRCRVTFSGSTYEGWIYYPHPETKERHFQDASIVEIIAPLIVGIGYGDILQLQISSDEATVRHEK